MTSIAASDVPVSPAFSSFLLHSSQWNH